MDKFKINFEIKFVVLFFGVFITLFSSWYFTRDDRSFEKVMNILQLGITFFALIYTAMSITAAAEARNEAVSANRKRAALEFINGYRELDVQGVTKKSKLARDAIRGKEAVEIMDILREMEEERGALHTTLNFFETMAIAVKHEVADENMMLAAFESIVLSHRRTMLGYIKKYRLDNGQPKFMRNFTDLADSWSGG